MLQLLPMSCDDTRSQNNARHVHNIIAFQNEVHIFRGEWGRGRGGVGYSSKHPQISLHMPHNEWN